LKQARSNLLELGWDSERGIRARVSAFYGGTYERHAKGYFSVAQSVSRIDAADGEIEIYGWNFDHPIFQRIFEVQKPTKIIEIGTLYGVSAIHMAKLAKEMGLEVEILCIDTVLGRRNIGKRARWPD
jgi:cephalosporin hydroxylase